MDCPKYFTFDEPIKVLGEFFRNSGFELYAVGGQVRNRLLGLPVQDLDVCSCATPEDLDRIFQNSKIRVVHVAPEFGSSQLHIDANGKTVVFEHTTFRSDVYPDGGDHKPRHVKFTDSLNTDAFRRDFSVNAIYASLNDGRLIDPVGGIQDLRNRIIRCTSKNPADVLKDDGLRILRLIRFSSELGFDIDPLTLKCATFHVKLLKDIKPERIWAELKKILVSDVRYSKEIRNSPYSSLSEFFLDLNSPFHTIFRMKSMGVFNFILPELIEGAGIRQRSEYHAYDVFNHNLMTCAMSAPTVTVRLASLLHDIAKPKCLKETGKMLYHDILGAEMTEDILSGLRVDKKTIAHVQLLVKHHMLDLQGNAKKSTIKKHFAQIGVAVSSDLVLVREADFLGSGRLLPPVDSAMKFSKILSEMIKRRTPFSEGEVNISGTDIMNALDIPPSELIGQIKRRIWLHCVLHPEDNRREKLLSIIKRFA